MAVRNASPSRTICRPNVMRGAASGIGGIGQRGGQIGRHRQAFRSIGRLAVQQVTNRRGTGHRDRPSETGQSPAFGGEPAVNSGGGSACSASPRGSAEAPGGSDRAAQADTSNVRGAASDGPTSGTRCSAEGRSADGAVARGHGPGGGAAAANSGTVRASNLNRSENTMCYEPCRGGPVRRERPARTPNSRSACIPG